MRQPHLDGAAASQQRPERAQGSSVSLRRTTAEPAAASREDRTARAFLDVVEVQVLASASGDVNGGPGRHWQGLKNLGCRRGILAPDAVALPGASSRPAPAGRDLRGSTSPPTDAEDAVARLGAHELGCGGPTHDVRSVGPLEASRIRMNLKELFWGNTSHIDCGPWFAREIPIDRRW